MASIDITTVLSVVTSVASSSAALAYWLGRKFTELNVKMRELDARLENLSNAFIQFSEILTLTLETKDIFTATEALHLKNVVRSPLPAPRSRYYTWEIYEKLKNILDKDLEEYTIADTEEINRIADLMEKEGREAGRRELVEYSWKLRFFTMVVKIVYIHPKLVRKPRGPQPRGMSTASSG